MEKVWNRPIRAKFQLMRPGEKEETFIKLDTEILYDLIDYKMQYSLEEGLEHTIKYYEHLHRNQ